MFVFYFVFCSLEQQMSLGRVVQNVVKNQILGCAKSGQGPRSWDQGQIVHRRVPWPAIPARTLSRSCSGRPAHAGPPRPDAWRQTRGRGTDAGADDAPTTSA